MRDLLWRIREAPKEYRYAGLLAAVRWIFTGRSVEEDYE